MTRDDATDSGKSAGATESAAANGGDDRCVYHVDGELVPATDATVSVRDRGFLYGDAAFETLRAYGGELFEWEAHGRRLAETCDVLGFDHGLSDGVLRDRVDETLAANGYAEAAVRLSVTRGIGSGPLGPGVDPGTGTETGTEPTVVVLVDELPRGGRESDPVWDGPATLQTVKTRRVPDRAVPARTKTHSYLNSVLARRELRVTGADEALVLDADGYVTGGAASTVFFVDDDALCTPSLDGPVYPGVTREVVVDLARDEGIPVREGRFTPDDVRSAAEVFVASTAWELRPVAAVDGIDCGGGPVTTLLSRLFDERVERACYGGTGVSEGRADDAEGVDSRWDVGGDDGS